MFLSFGPCRGQNVSQNASCIVTVLLLFKIRTSVNSWEYFFPKISLFSICDHIKKNKKIQIALSEKCQNLFLRYFFSFDFFFKFHQICLPYSRIKKNDTFGNIFTPLIYFGKLLSTKTVSIFSNLQIINRIKTQK